MKYPNVTNQIPDLVDKLGKVETYHAFERKYIGQAIANLILLKDILEDINKKESNNV